MKRKRAFTLVEMLVVIVILLLVSAVVLPAVLPALSHQSVNEAGRILQGQLVQARDIASRYNAPRGVRFMPDPTYPLPLSATGIPAWNSAILASNRMIPLEPGPDYTTGMVTVWPVPNPALTPPAGAVFPSPDPYPIGSGFVYPYYLNSFAPTLNPSAGQVLMIEQAPFIGNNPNTTQGGGLNEPTNWYWNIRLGDQIRIGGTGTVYTVVGPCTQNPLNGAGNPELFVNVGAPGSTPTLARTYSDTSGNQAQFAAEYLYLVNGSDDNGDGYVDSGWDGITNFLNGVTPGVPDNITEWEAEKWTGGQTAYGANDATNTAFNAAVLNSPAATAANQLMAPTSYTIKRRPVPSQGARETMLPQGAVIDMTLGLTGNPERSRLPIDQFTGYVDIMLLPSGVVVPTTAYSTPSSVGFGGAFYQFWIAERQDVHAPGELWGLDKNGVPIPNPNATATIPYMFQLPLPQDAYAGGSVSLSHAPQFALKGEHSLVTLFTHTGQISIMTTASGTPQTGSSIAGDFNAYDISQPFYNAQLGVRDAR